MNGLLHRLWTTAKKWREDKRDLHLLRKFLDSPAGRLEIAAKSEASGHAKLFMLTLMRFAESDLDRLECLTNGMEVWWSFPDDLPAPAGVLARWMSLAETGGWGVTGTVFEYVTETRPVLLGVHFPYSLERSSGDDVETELMKCKVPAPCIVVSKLPVASQAS